MLAGPCLLLGGVQEPRDGPEPAELAALSVRLHAVAHLQRRQLALPLHISNAESEGASQLAASVSPADAVSCLHDFP
jgi:hypothetical protein